MDTSNLIYDAHTLVARAGGGTADPNRPPVYKAVGLTLAVTSGLLIGTSFVLKKTGLLRANEKYNEEAGEGYGYLKNAYWWAGMILMILGEVCNFVAYAFVDAILVTPLGALSVVVTTILSAIFLKERLSFVGKIGCFNCIIGSVVIVMNAPEQSAVADIQEMKTFVIHPGFLTYAGVIIVACIFIALWVAPRYGKKSMLVYLTICSLIGGLSVVATQGLGSAIVAQAGGKAQFNQWFLYVLLVFVIATLLTEIIYLNKALNLFNAALVTPTYYVIFTTATIVTSAVLFRGFHGTPVSIATVIMGFLQICAGVVLLQLSKSAKDVPDAAIFKGDLDQVREVANQEQPESEPKADALRGTAAIIRRISQSRAKMEQAEFRRLHEEKLADHLEPVKENEIIEWDGLRRRKTIIGENSSIPNSPVVRRRTVHPPLGMSHFPDPEQEEMEERERAQTSGSILESIRHRASSIFHPMTPRTVDRDQPQSPMHPVALTDIQVHPAKTESPLARYGSDGALGDDHIYGLQQGLRKPSSMKAMPSPRSKPLPDRPDASPMSPPSPHQLSARRQFSFTNFLNRNPRTATPGVDGVDEMPELPSRAGLGSRGSSYSHEQKKAMKNATEEERLGLVKGDSHHALLHSSPERTHYPLQPIPSRAESVSSNSEIEDDGDDYDGQYAYNSRSGTQAHPRGRNDISYSRTRSSDSDGNEDSQMTTYTNDPTLSTNRPAQIRTISNREQPPSLQQVSSVQQRPPSRRRPSPPRNYQAPPTSQFIMPSNSNSSNSGADPMVREAILYPVQGSHSRTRSDQQAGAVPAVQVAQPVPMASSHSRNLSTSRTHIRMVSQSQDQSQNPDRGRLPLRAMEREDSSQYYTSHMRQEQSPDNFEEGDISGASSNSKKRYEMQSAREREERRKRMSSGWSNPGTGSGAPQGFI